MTPMKLPPNDPQDRRERLSGLLDGDAGAADEVCGWWSDDPALRQTWHTYQLIGDVLRSEDLATLPGRDAAFLSALRVRLAAEPVVVAPQPRSGRAGPARTANRSWMTPVALAAGFVAVAGVVTVVRLSEPATESQRTLAVAAPPASELQVARVPDGEVLRDARVDEYLRLHRAALVGSPAALPGGAMRNVDLVMPQR